MWPLGQAHKLWLVPNLSTRGPLKAITQLQPNQLSSAVQPHFPSADWVAPEGTTQLPACVAQPHTWYPITLEWPLHLFHTSVLDPKAHFYYYLWLWLVNMYIYIIMNYLVACVCRIETDSASWFVCNWFVCNWYIVCSVLCILQLCTLEQLIK